VNSSGESPRLGEFRVFRDHRGALGIAEFEPLPFPPQRLFWISSVTEGETRANHGHRICQQLVFVQQGSVKGFTIDASGGHFDFELDEGDWVHVPVRHWLQLSSFADGTVVGVFASHPFDDADYIDEVDELDS
jgi:UDP-2-acetamido-3-amino-2,3-dideoxy-glucuronate N-acetyltransferase